MNEYSLEWQSPPGFCGFNPNEPVEIYHRRLPHWRQNNATYFVTFRLADSIPQPQLRALKRWREQWEESHPEPRNFHDWEELAKQITRKTNAWMDDGFGECVFRDRRFANVLTSSLLHFQDSRCLTSCFVVMPNHVHAVMRPIDDWQLEDILESVKGFVSRKVNSELRRSKPLWSPESYDRIVRDESHLFKVVQYIGRNPSKARLHRSQWIRWIHPDWQKAGWRFLDE